MAIYTYEVDHGDDAPKVFAGMEINGGKVQAVEFGAALSKKEKLDEAVANVADSYSAGRIAGTDDHGITDLNDLIKTAKETSET